MKALLSALVCACAVTALLLPPAQAQEAARDQMTALMQRRRELESKLWSLRSKYARAPETQTCRADMDAARRELAKKQQECDREQAYQQDQFDCNRHQKYAG